MTAAAGDTLLSVHGAGVDAGFAEARQRLRRQLRERRKRLPPRARRLAARKACRGVLRSPVLRGLERCATYLSSGSKLDTTALIAGLHRRGITVYVPVLRPHSRMVWVRLGRHSRLHPARHGLREPRPTRPRCFTRALRLMILPLVGYDERGTRLGAGGGYYDRLPERPHHRPLRLGYAYAVQHLSTLPRAPWDIPLRRIATDRRPPWPIG
jgi:5-formyltetrahydrofolate cyclo-ligase